MDAALTYFGGIIEGYMIDSSSLLLRSQTKYAECCLKRDSRRQRETDEQREIER